MKNKALFTIFLVVFIDLLGFGIILPLLPFIAEEYAATPLQIGLLTSVYSFFQLIASPILGKLSDRYGRKKILVLSQFGSMVGFIILGLANSLPLLFVSRIIDGITGGNISIAQAYIADVTDAKNRTKGMGVLGAAFGLGFILGPAMGGLLAKISYSAPAYVAAVVSLISMVATWLLLNETVKKQNILNTRSRKNWHLKEMLTEQPLGFLLVVFLLINLAFASMQGSFALWTERSFGFGPSENGGVFAVVGIISTITQLLLLPRIVRLYGERKTMSVGMISMSIGLLLFSVALYPWMVFAILPFLALGNGLVNPTLQAVASENVPKDRYGEMLGVLQSFGSLGRIIGPTLGGYLFGMYGKNVPFVFGGFLVLGTFLGVLHFLPRNQSAYVRILHRFGFK